MRPDGLKIKRRTRPLARGLPIVLVLGGLLLAALAAVPAAAQEEGSFPEVIPLPVGFQPEGIAIGRGTTFYVGSIPTGAIFKGNLRTGEGGILVEGRQGRAAIGLGFDRRSGYVFVAGGPTGKAFIYNGETGADIAEFQLAGPGPTFVNDVAVSREAAYFTDSAQPVLYRISLGPEGEPLVSEGVRTIPLGGDYQFVPGAFNANGIEATPNGKWLIIVNSAARTLYRVDPESGVATAIDLGEAELPNGDGLLLQGRILYVVQNRLNQVAVVRLEENFTSGAVVNTLTSTQFDVPTTIDKFGSYLYAVNARFGNPAPAEAEYWVTRISKQ